MGLLMPSLDVFGIKWWFKVLLAILRNVIITLAELLWMDMPSAAVVFSFLCPFGVYDSQVQNTQIISHSGMVLQYSTHGKHHLQCGRPARLQAHLPRLYTLVKASFLLVKSPLMVNRCLSANQFRI